MSFKTGTVSFADGSDGNESTCKAGDQVQSLHQEEPLEKEMATHSGILAWRIPWREERAGYIVHAATRVGHSLATKALSCGRYPSSKSGEDKFINNGT